MPSLKVEIDISGYVAAVGEDRARNIPFAVAKALTRTAQDGQIEVKRELGQKFKLRNAWTQQGIRITPAQKLSWPIQAEVYTDTSNARTGAPDYLVAQDEGGEKVPFGGGHHLAIPTRYLRAHFPGAIPDAVRPRNLLPADAAIGTAYRGRLDGPSTGPKFGRVSRKTLKSLGSAEFVAFLQVDHHGSLVLFVRRPGQRDPEPWYVLVTSAHIRPVLQVAETVARIADERFEQHWDDAWDDIQAKA